jgi:hypothetical protein
MAMTAAIDNVEIVFIAYPRHYVKRQFITKDLDCLALAEARPGGEDMHAAKRKTTSRRAGFRGFPITASLRLFTGGDFWPPLAIAGGVGLSSILSLVFTPAVYHLIYRPMPAPRAAETATAGRSVSTRPTG